MSLVHARRIAAAAAATRAGAAVAAASLHASPAAPAIAAAAAQRRLSTAAAAACPASIGAARVGHGQAVAGRRVHGMRPIHRLQPQRGLSTAAEAAPSSAAGSGDADAGAAASPSAESASDEPSLSSPPRPIVTAEERAETDALLEAWSSLTGAERATEDAQMAPALFFRLLREGREEEAWRVHGEAETAAVLALTSASLPSSTNGAAAGAGADGAVDATTQTDADATADLNVDVDLDAASAGVWNLSRTRVWLEALEQHGWAGDIGEAERAYLRLVGGGGQADAALYRQMIQLYMWHGGAAQLEKAEAFWAEARVRTAFSTDDYSKLILWARQCALPEQVALWSARARVAGVYYQLDERTRFAEVIHARDDIFEQLTALDVRVRGRFHREDPDQPYGFRVTRDREFLYLRNDASQLFRQFFHFSAQRFVLSYRLRWSDVSSLLDVMRSFDLYEHAMSLVGVVMQQELHAVEQDRFVRRWQRTQGEKREQQRAAWEESAGLATIFHRGAAVDEQTQVQTQQSTAASVTHAEAASSEAAPTAAAAAATPTDAPDAAPASDASSSASAATGTSTDPASTSTSAAAPAQTPAATPAPTQTQAPVAVFQPAPHLHEAVPPPTALAWSERMPSSLVLRLLEAVSRAPDGSGAEGARRVLLDMLTPECAGRFQVPPLQSLELLLRLYRSEQHQRGDLASKLRSVYDSFAQKDKDAALHRLMLGEYARAHMVAEARSLCAQLESEARDPNTVVLAFQSLLELVQEKMSREEADVESDSLAPLFARGERLWSRVLAAGADVGAPGSESAPTRNSVNSLLDARVVRSIMQLCAQAGQAERAQAVIDEALRLEQQQGSATATATATTAEDSVAATGVADAAAPPASSSSSSSSSTPSAGASVVLVDPLAFASLFDAFAHAAQPKQFEAQADVALRTMQQRQEQQQQTGFEQAMRSYQRFQEAARS